MKRREGRFIQRHHQRYRQPGRRRREDRQRRLDFARRRKHPSVRRVVLVRVVLMRAGGIPVMVRITVVLVCADLVDEAGMLKQRVRRGR